MFLWRRTAELHWVKAHEDRLQEYADGRLVIVRRPGRKRLQLEIVCRRRSDLSVLLGKFGGRIKVLPRNWLELIARANSKPIKIGKRLVLVRSRKKLRHCSVRCPQRSPGPDALRTAHSTAQVSKARFLTIPASTAFGTGEHATTAMSLRLLEQLTRSWKPGWSLVDLGTGSGILALAAKCLGAERAVGIDNDPAAISVAKSNARSNGIRGVTFQLRDVRKWKSVQKTDVITANLYSDLLIEILPKLGGTGWLILSGVLRSHKEELVRALQQTHLNIVDLKSRGKWMAFLTKPEAQCATHGSGAGKLCGDQRPPLQ